MKDLFKFTVHELANLLSTGVVTSEEIVLDAFSRVDVVEPKIHAFITENREKALRCARTIDDDRSKGVKLPRLAGIPVAIKDNICTKDIRTTAASKMLSNLVPPYDATVIERIIASRMVIIGKMNMDEFAMGSSTETSYFGATRNPWDLTAVPGGTSGGSAAAVASGEIPIALGSDTGGSIRQPASFCGVVGLKPTYGRVSRYGLIAYVSSFDQIGVLSRDTMDCALLLEIISGHDPKDSTSIDVDVPSYSSGITNAINGLRIGIPREYLGHGLDSDVKRSIEDAIQLLRELGVICTEISLPTSQYAIPTYYVIATSEASANLARYDGVKYGHRTTTYTNVSEMIANTRAEGFGPEVKRRILLGAFALSSGYYEAYYLKAQKVRTLIKKDYQRAFENVDALLMPVSPFPAFGIGEKISNPLAMYLSDVHTVTANLAGIPALSLPFGVSRRGLPIGVQLQGPPLSEDIILKIAYNLERARGPFRWPPI